MQKAYTVEAWAREWFQCGVGRWNPRTEGGYRNLIERHIVPGVGKVKLEALKPVHINRLYAELAEKGLSAKSVWCIHLLLCIRGKLFLCRTHPSQHLFQRLFVVHDKIFHNDLLFARRLRVGSGVLPADQLDADLILLKVVLRRQRHGKDPVGV